MKIIAINISKSKGTPKREIPEAELIAGHGVEDDAHAGDWHRQVSFLASEAIHDAREQGLEVEYGDFAENITTEGVAWETLPIGTKVKLGPRAVVEITQIGKVCHKPCAIYYRSGDCIMPKQGVFGKVLVGGIIRKDDEIVLMS